MKLGRAWVVGMATAFAAGCALTPKEPVPILASATDRDAMAGRWEGEFSSSVTGREGTIVFDLTASADTARGEVWMIGRPVARNVYPGDAGSYNQISRPAEVLRIHFVRVQGGLLTGVLDPYFEPETGVELITIFRGRLEGNVISGEYASTNQETGELSTGRWRVERKVEKAVDERR